MKKTILISTILVGFLNACVPNVVVDTKGRSGTFDNSRADEITDDLITCKTLAKDNTNMFVESGKYVWNYYFRSATLWLSPKAEYDYPMLYRNCLKGRNHNVIN